MEKIKYVHRQDSGFKLSAGNSGETSLNLSNEIFDLITKGSMKLGEERNVTFKLYKEDCIKAVCFIILKLPLYQSSSNASTKVVDNLIVFQNLIGKINYFFGENEIVDYTVNLYYRTDGRIYLNRLKVDGFSIRDVLVENNSALLFKEESNGKIALRILSDIKDGETVDAVEQEIQLSLPLQQVFYGAPGTGKSHKVNMEIQNTPNALVLRTTFHPDSDYSTFVGAYKPTMKHIKSHVKLNMSLDDLAKELNTLYNDESLGNIGGLQKFCFDYHMYLDGEYMSVNHGELVKRAKIAESYKFEIPKYLKFYKLFPKQADSKIVYSFVPQAFLKAYVAAWQNPEQPVFLVIEEINRGNCAQIFGDIFQLLDRKDGVSEYPIKADQDIRDYLAKEFAGYDLDANILSGEELVLPANLHIWATMNTSDQSLFPIDSAFKRRWDWKYMPIHDSGEKWRITLSDAEYDWWSFVEKINEVIGDMTSSEDKKLGYFFCKACDKKIDAEKFVNKVIFYLWNDVLKDYELPEEFKYGELKNKGNSKSEYMSFNDFYESDGSADEVTIAQLMKNLKVTEFDKEQSLDMTEEESSVPPKTSLSVSETKRLNFWTEFLDFSKDKASMFADKKPTYALWKNFSIDGIKRSEAFINIEYIVSQKAVRVNLITSKEVYQNLEENKSAFELKLAGLSLEWRPSPDAKNSAIRIVRNDVDFDNIEERESLFQFIVDTANRLGEGAKEFIK